MKNLSIICRGKFPKRPLDYGDKTKRRVYRLFYYYNVASRGNAAKRLVRGAQSIAENFIGIRFNFMSQHDFQDQFGKYAFAILRRSI